MHPDLQAALVTLQLALVSTTALLLLGLPLAWWLSRGGGRHRALVEALVALPLVLPPTVLGFYLLLLSAPDSWPGAAWLAMTGTPLAFSFSGLVLGSLVYSLPFVVQPLRAGFSAVPQGLLDAAASLGARPLQRFRHVVLPVARRSLLVAGVLAFAHTLGEFGVVLMIGGNIPGETRVLSVALYEHVEAMDYARAHSLAGGLLLVSLALLLPIYLWGAPVRLVQAR